MKRNGVLLLLLFLGVLLGFILVLSSKRLADFYYSQMGYLTD